MIIRALRTSRCPVFVALFYPVLPTPSKGRGSDGVFHLSMLGGFKRPVWSLQTR